MKRQQNQDSGIVCPDLGLCIVADGMGGHQGGETASRMVIEIVPEMIRKARTASSWNPKKDLSDAIQEANRAIFKRSREDRKLQGMGTTTTCLVFEGSQMTIGHVGDSRCYFARPGILWQLTRDHSLVQEKLRAGLITREQLKTDQMRNVITRSVGFEPHVQVELYEKEVHPGDIYLVCSDGLSGMVEDTQIQNHLDQRFFSSGKNLSRAGQELIELANSCGGEDNVSVLLAYANEEN